jgi:hypothetical protein
MISVQDAVKSVRKYIDEFSDLLPRGGLRLEETVFDQGENVWLITVSFENDVLGLGSIDNTRIYKKFIVDGNYGKVTQMTNFKL